MNLEVVLRAVRSGNGSVQIVNRTVAARCSSTQARASALTSGVICSMTSPLGSVVVALGRQGIIPDVIPPAFTPTLFFSIVYPTGREVATGNTLLREDTLDEPDVVITPMNLPFANADSTGEGDDLVKEVSYTLVMTDPDAPSRADPKYRQFRHWVVRITNSTKLFVHILRTYLRN